MQVGHFGQRLAAVAERAGQAGIDAVLVTPGPDLQYLVGYDAVPLERLTCLVVTADGQARLVVPRLEALAASASPAGSLGIEILTWGESDDPYERVGALVGAANVVALDNHMWAEKVLRLRSAMPRAQQVLAADVIAHLRMRKDPEERAALQRAGSAIDAVHASVPAMLRPGRTEREIGADISTAILDVGHVRVDFVIVASGPNGASPHHEVSDRIVQRGDAVVVDIGGTMPDGYRSDCTRTYVVGAPDPEFSEMYQVLKDAQAASVARVGIGISAETVDAAGRGVLAAAGLGELFIHRTGHGIGLETHEDPYIVEGNELALDDGMAFSIEPGFYLEGRFGARIEDIVIATSDGTLIVNNQTRDLVEV